MTVLRDIPFSLSPEYVVQEQQRRHSRPARPWMFQVAQEAIALSLELARPVVVYDEFGVQGLCDERLLLETNHTAELAIGARVHLLSPAHQVLVGVSTIGPALEERVRQLNAAGETLLAYMLDTVGVLALGAAGEAFRCLAEERAAALGWGVSPALSPGSLVGWSLAGQRELCALLPLDEIGVRLNAHYVLEPHKSTSVLIGLGPGYESTHVGSVCRFCSLADTCWRRRGDAA
ncbi:MAG: hypothetical protein ACOYZ7_18015 [Chloroflexota bacterium]